MPEEENDATLELGTLRRFKLEDREFGVTKRTRVHCTTPERARYQNSGFFFLLCKLNSFRSLFMKISHFVA